MSVATELDLSRIIRDPEIQPRETMNADTITQYAEDMLTGIVFPDVVVYHDPESDRYWLSQGFHRCEAAEQAGFVAIIADVRDGTRQDALWDAAGSNREHDTAGLRRSNADKQRAIRLALEAKPDASAKLIAKQVGVNDTTVSSFRERSRIPAPDRVNGADGKSYPSKRLVVNGRDESSRAEIDWPETTGSNLHKCERCGRLIPQDYTLCTGCRAVVKDEELPEPFVLAVIDEVKPATRPTFNATNDMVDWARWTWNPVTGCKHDCCYCYARDIANRFYPEKFEPTYRPERLEAPRNTRPPAIANDSDPVKATAWKNVFVCSMADLFGRWVPDEWIDGVFESCRRSPEWNYLFLSKFPQRYVKLDFPATAWVGTSVDEQKRVANAQKAFAKIDVPVKWLSVEPMRERIVFDDLSMFDWVVIGGQSRSSGAPEFHPEPWWVIDLAWRAREAGCKVYLKPNTFAGPGWQIKEYPYAETE